MLIASANVLFDWSLSQINCSSFQVPSQVVQLRSSTRKTLTEWSSIVLCSIGTYVRLILIYSFLPSIYTIHLLQGSGYIVGYDEEHCDKKLVFSMFILWLWFNECCAKTDICVTSSTIYSLYCLGVDAAASSFDVYIHTRPRFVIYLLWSERITLSFNYSLLIPTLI